MWPYTCNASQCNTYSLRLSELFSRTLDSFALPCRHIDDFKSSSRSSVFFGIQSGMEVIVVWRFWNVAPARRRESENSNIATIGITFFLIALALAVEAVIFGLVTHDEPTTSNASLLCSSWWRYGYFFVIWLER
ncbi:hypothetical protein MPER_08643 [Moniliophthora perniciosa FA553]|nr:hypothetical protein MPER_08643 [Moniliophthora perniciosa FA553]